jgi:Kdo2-lipid IVA lauroyltransferase/acyltransferase
MAKPRGPFYRWMTRTIGHRVEGALVLSAAALFKALPLDAASALGGWIGRTIGPRLPGSRTADANLRRAMPELSPAERRRIVRGMWDNLGRTMAEYPHLLQIARERVEMAGGEHIAAMRDDDRGGIMVSGHFANWEIASAAVYRQSGLKLALVYRAPNNPYSARLIVKLRTAGTDINIPKGADGARQLLRHVSAGGHVGILVDQKLNDGIAVPFFGRPAMTATAPAALALRLKLPLHPVHVVRTGGAHFRMRVEPAMVLPDTGDRHADALEAMTTLNALLESWIRACPEQWLWLHRRWPDDDANP